MHIDYELKLDQVPGYCRITCISAEPKAEIGYAVLDWDPDGKDMELRDLWIHAELGPVNFRQRGYGSILVKEAIRVAKEHGIKRFWGTTQIDDYPVHRFYEKNGFTVSIRQDCGNALFEQRI